MTEEMEIKCADERLIKGLKHDAHSFTRGFIVKNTASGVKPRFIMSITCRKDK